MARLIATTVATVAVALTGVLTATAAPDEGLSPACADITGGGFSLVGGTLGGSLETADGTSCSSVRYTLNVTFVGPSGRTMERSQTVRGSDSAGVVLFTVHLPPSVTSACVYATTTTSSGALVDRAPDAGADDLECNGAGVVVTAGSGGGSTFN
jgi:hypothetical protein